MSEHPNHKRQSSQATVQPLDNEGGLTPTRSIIQIKEARKTFRTPEGTELRALDDISLEILDNEFLTLLGPSGCGKTTLLRMIAGFENIDGGSITFDGKQLDGVPTHRRPFNTVFQHYSLFPHLSVANNVGYGLDVSGVAKKERNERVASALELVNLSGFDQRKPKQLSGGQQQRVALARAIINRPRLLLLDEPLSALDRKLRETMQIELKNLQHTLGITFVFVTHDQEEALAMSDRVAIMNSGRILQLDDPASIYHRPVNQFVADFVGLSNIFGGRVTRNEGGEAIIETETGNEIHAAGVDQLVGTRVDAVLRPEQLAVEGSLEKAKATLEVTVDQVVFTGSEHHVYARLTDGTRVISLHRQEGAPPPTPENGGPKLRLGYRPQDVHVMNSGEQL